MKLTDEERKELRELYDAYKNVKDTDSLKLLGGLIRTSKWYKNHKLTLNHRDSYMEFIFFRILCFLYHAFFKRDFG